MNPESPLDPAETNEQRLGGLSQATEVANVSTADAGVELPVPSDGPAVDAGPPPPPGEPCLAEAFGGSCYAFFGERLPWAVAEQRCVDWGGYLASVGSAGEDDFLEDWPQALGIPSGEGSNLWLGGTDAEQEGAFRWQDDGPFEFGNWGANQPDNGAGVDCIAKRNDGTASWYDQRCSDSHYYVCERPL